MFFPGSPSLSVKKLFLSTNSFLRYVQKDRGGVGGMGGTGTLPWVHLCSSLDIPMYIAAADAVHGHEGVPQQASVLEVAGRAEQKSV